MIRFLLRFAGLWLFAIALVAAVIDGAKTIAAAELVLTPLGLAWSQLAPVSLIQTQFAIEEHLGQPWLWDVIAEWVLSAPVWLVFGILGLLLMLLGRRRQGKSLGERRTLEPDETLLEQGEPPSAFGVGDDGTVSPASLPADLVPLVLDHHVRSGEARTERFGAAGELVTFQLFSTTPFILSNRDAVSSSFKDGRIMNRDS